MEIQETKTVWLAITNTDCTEGRGKQYPKFVCEKKATALRLGKKGYIMGSDCPVEEAVAIKVNNCWLIPGCITPGTEEDDRTQKAIDEKTAMIKKFKDAGFTQADIDLLR